MNKFLSIIFFLLISAFAQAQNNSLEKFSILFGNWEGTGEGFGSSKSIIQSAFKLVLNKQFIEVKNHSEFQPTNKNPKGEIHDDWGIISYDTARKKYVFRQFHVEGFINQYILNDSLSTENKLIFESEFIENFVPGGTARFTIIIKSNNEIETIFDVGMPGKELVCYGTNHLKKKE